MSEWVESLLGDVLKFGNGKSRPKEIGHIPVYGGNGILEYCDKSNYDSETIIIGRVGAYCGATYYENRQVWISDNALSAKTKDDNDTKFLFYLLKNLDLNQFAQGSSHPLLTQTLLNSIEVFLTRNLKEQQAIASVLSSLDDKIDLLHRQNKTLEAMAETLFRQWFIEEAKDDWEVKKLGDLANITSSKRIFYSEYVEIGIPFYRSKEIIELSKVGSTKSELNISFEKFSEIDNKFGSPKLNDILITAVGTLGIIYQVKNNSKFYFKDGNLIWLKDFKNVHSNVIYAWLKSDIGQETLYSISIGSTQPALTIVGLKNIELNLPPENTLIELSKYLETFYKKVNQNFSQIQTLENLRDTLLPKLMSGEVRVQH